MRDRGATGRPSSSRADGSRAPSCAARSSPAAEVSQTPSPYPSDTTSEHELTHPCSLRSDWEIVRNHDGDQQTAHLDTRYNLQTHDGAVLYLRTTGTRTGKREVLEALGEGKIGPDQFRMRLNLTFETGDERYSWLNQGVFVASSGRVGDQGESSRNGEDGRRRVADLGLHRAVIYDAYQVL